MVGTYNKSHSGGKEKAEYVGPCQSVMAAPDIAKVLGLKPQLSAEEVANLTLGLTADGRQLKGKRKFHDTAERKRVRFTDMTFSAPLSFSVAHALAQPDEQAVLETCFTRANAAYMSHILERLGYVRSKEEPGHVACLTFAHYSARPTEQPADPQRHNHNLVLHTCVTPSGKLLTPNLSALRGRVHAFGAVGHVYLANYLREAGVNVGIDPKTGLLRLTDVPEKALSVFGNRHKQAGEGSVKQRRGRIMSTRRGKDAPADPVEWRARLEAIGYQHQPVINRGGKAEPVSEAVLNATGKRTAGIRRMIVEGGVSKQRIDALLGYPHKPAPQPKRQASSSKIKVGSQIRLNKIVNARYEKGTTGRFAGIGAVVTVRAYDAEWITLEKQNGKIGKVRWKTLLDKKGVFQADVVGNKKVRKTVDYEDIRKEFEQELRTRGVVLDGPAVMDGEWHRVRVANDRGEEYTATYKAYLGRERPTGFVRNPANPEMTGVWEASAKMAPMSVEQHAAYMSHRSQTEKQQKQRVEAAGARARATWAEAKPASPQHPYLEGKEVGVFGVRQTKDGDILLPAWNADSRRIENVQRITWDHDEQRWNKQFIKDARKTGLFGVIGKVEIGKPFVIATDYESAASIHQASGLPVVYAFDSANLPAVAEIWRRVEPSSKIIIAAENNHDLERRTDVPAMLRYNAGMQKAQQALDAVGAWNGAVVAPHFGALEQGRLIPGKKYPTTWNGLQNLVGEERMKRELVQLLQLEGVDVEKNERTEQRVTQEQRDAARKRSASETPMTPAQMAAQRQAEMEAQRGHNRGPSL